MRTVSFREGMAYKWGDPNHLLQVLSHRLGDSSSFQASRKSGSILSKKGAIDGGIAAIGKEVKV